MMQCSFLAFKGDMSHYHLENIQQPQNMTRLHIAQKMTLFFFPSAVSETTTNETTKCPAALMLICGDIF